MLCYNLPWITNLQSPPPLTHKGKRLVDCRLRRQHLWYAYQSPEPYATEDDLPLGEKGKG